MDNKSKTKKMMVVLSSIAVTLGSISLSSFATTGTEESGSTSIIGISNNIDETKEKQIDNPDETSSKLENDEKIFRNSEPGFIDIKEPGNYILIGDEAWDTGNGTEIDVPDGFNNAKKIIVGNKDNIRITGSGDYNVMLCNVVIGYDNMARIPLKISGSSSKVKLILVGENILVGRISASIDGGYGCKELTITENSEGASLDVSNRGAYGIYTSGLVKIDGGDIRTNGIIADDIIINKGKFTSSGFFKGHDDDDTIDDVKANHITVNGGVLLVNSLKGKGDPRVQMTRMFGRTFGTPTNFVNKITINDGIVDTVAINGDITMINGELKTKKVNKKTFNGKFFNELRNNKDGNQYTYNDLHVSGGIINIFNFTADKRDKSEDHKLKDNGKTFVGANPANNFCDTTVDFDN